MYIICIYVYILLFDTSMRKHLRVEYLKATRKSVRPNMEKKINK